MIINPVCYQDIYKSLYTPWTIVGPEQTPEALHSEEMLAQTVFLLWQHTALFQRCRTRVSSEQRLSHQSYRSHLDATGGPQYQKLQTSQLEPEEKLSPDIKYELSHHISL